MRRSVSSFGCFLPLTTISPSERPFLTAGSLASLLVFLASFLVTLGGARTLLDLRDEGGSFSIPFAGGGLFSMPLAGGILFSVSLAGGLFSVSLMLVARLEVSARGALISVLLVSERLVREEEDLAPLEFSFEILEDLEVRGLLFSLFLLGEDLVLVDVSFGVLLER